MPSRITLAALLSALAMTTHAGTPETPYLAASALPSGAIFLPPPPVGGSVAATLDWQVFLDGRAIKQQDPRRWALATDDSDLQTSKLMGDFDCALGVTLDRNAMPGLYRLLGRSGLTLHPAIAAAEKHFARARPYLNNHQPICVARFTRLDHTPSYPSESAATGWSAALILAELAPDRADRILARGRVLGESRIVCGVHWLSDVQAATIAAAGLVATLHAEPAFRADLDQARREIQTARANNAAVHPGTAACTIATEAAARPVSSIP